MRDVTAHAGGTNKWGIAASDERTFSLEAVLDSAQVSRVLGDMQVTVRVECDKTIGASETRRQRVVALTKRL
jgi:hypothetical protein